MVRTHVQLTETQAQKLKEIATEQGVPIAVLIRRAIDDFLASGNFPLSEDKFLSRQEKWQRSLEILGKFDSGLSDVSTNHDHYLAEAYGEW